MPGTYSQLLLHIVFATKLRRQSITPDMAPRLYRFIGGIVRSEKGTLLNIGGTADHLHLYVRWRTDDSISNLLRNIKSRSSTWIHQTYPTLNLFTWQEGYSVFTVSKSQEAAVKKYIADQPVHHRKEDFKTELLRLLKAHGIEHDQRFVFD